MKTLKELKKGCGKKYIADIREKTPEGVKFRIGMATCDGNEELPYCEVCQALINQQEEILKIVEEKLNNLADNLPQENNHNFNRNSIISKIKNEALILKKEFGELENGK